MPSVFTVPSRTMRWCTPCEHLKHHNMVCSRLHGITCDYVCHHPEAHSWNEVIKDPKAAELAARLRARMVENGRMIGRRDQQPDWCPLRRKGEHGG